MPLGTETDFRKVIKEDYEEVFSEDEMPVMLDYLKENLDAKKYWNSADVCDRDKVRSTGGS